MSEEYQQRERKRKVARSRRNQPTLISPTDTEQVQNTQEPIASAPEATGTHVEPVDELETGISSITSPKKRGFFSTIGGEADADGAAKGTEAQQARLARATRGKAKDIAKQGSTEKEISSKEASKPRSTATKSTPTRPASAFKTRYIFGMVIYIVVAEVVMTIIQRFGKGPTLTTIFGQPITASILAYLATLVLLLIILTRLDLFPRGLAGTGASNRKGQTSRENASNNLQERKNVPPPQRQGVKGEDDELYQQYRANQRRLKKR